MKAKSTYGVLHINTQMNLVIKRISSFSVLHLINKKKTKISQVVVLFKEWKNWNCTQKISGSRTFCKKNM